mmetsp:Transcript_11246/g.16411  ORF Transcript_11246/g.16411 Transcript_11246/m.16411 type:complete len:162 (+) Transcript_11246:2-487(+)
MNAAITTGENVKVLILSELEQDDNRVDDKASGAASLNNSEAIQVVFDADTTNVESSKSIDSQSDVICAGSGKQESLRRNIMEDAFEGLSLMKSISNEDQSSGVKKDITTPEQDVLVDLEMKGDAVVMKDKGQSIPKLKAKVTSDNELQLDPLASLRYKAAH